MYPEVTFEYFHCNFSLTNCEYFCNKGHDSSYVVFLHVRGHHETVVDRLLFLYENVVSFRLFPFVSLS